MNSEIKQKFGNRVRELRKRKGWSQEEFADRCKLDRTYISGIERGVRNPTLEIVEIISLKLETSLSVFFDWSQSEKIN